MLKPTVSLLFLLLATLPVAAQVGGRQLHEFRTESHAFNQHDPFSNAYRAGHYNGYLAGLVDALQGRSVCFKECPCELDKLVGAHLDKHPDALEQSAATWLVPLLEATYPCQRADNTAAGSGLLNR